MPWLMMCAVFAVWSEGGLGTTQKEWLLWLQFSVEPLLRASARYAYLHILSQVLSCAHSLRCRCFHCLLAGWNSVLLQGYLSASIADTTLHTWHGCHC